jgi:hypothetical protein
MMKLRLLGLLVSILLGVGCSGGQTTSGSVSNEEATVKGQVMIRGKKVTSGTVVFQAQGHEPVEAAVQKDGTFALKSWAGTNIVTVQGAELEKATANMPIQPPTDLMPGENTVDLIY